MIIHVQTLLLRKWWDIAVFATTASSYVFHCVAIPLWIVPVDLMHCLEYTELMATVFMTKVQINYITLFT